MNIKFVNKDSINVDCRGFDTIYFDPPYDLGFYRFIPNKTECNKTLIVWGSNPYIGDIFSFAVNSGWGYSFMITWDTISSWYVPGRVLMRDNIVIVFSDKKYNEENAIIYDGKYRPSKRTFNSRGDYLSHEKSYSKLSTVYKLMRSTMLKSHPHEKPWQLTAAIFGATSSVNVVDLFCGGGNAAIAARISECKSYVGYDIDREAIEFASRNYEKHDNIPNFTELKMKKTTLF